MPWGCPAGTHSCLGGPGREGKAWCTNFSFRPEYDLPSPISMFKTTHTDVSYLQALAMDKAGFTARGSQWRQAEGV